MLILAGKARPNELTGDAELHLPSFRQMLREQGRFVYAWSFNPDDRAMAVLRHCIESDEGAFLYLLSGGRKSSLRMHIADYFHNRNGIPTCPHLWGTYCISALQGKQDWGVHVWFLIDSIDELPEPVDLLKSFSPAFSDKYKNWGQNYFAFLR